MLFKKLRSSNAENLGFVDQRAAKSLAAKVGVLKKKCVALTIPAKLCESAFGLGWSAPGVKLFSKFDGQ